MKQVLLTILFLTGANILFAQRFEVQSFRLLENDITAWMNPVRDLNQEACALLKIVGSPDFVFSTPLGIVKRLDKVGEIWIYVPHGTIQLTIKHPQWGVLRDFPFPDALEARLSYELVLLPPPPVIPAQEKSIEIRRISLKLKNESPVQALCVPRDTHLKKKRPLFFSLINAGWSQKRFSYGLTLGFVKKHGAFLHMQSDLCFLSTQGECNREGILSGSEQIPYYTGNTFQSRHIFTAGALHRIVGLFYLYEGIGYGNRTVSWETLEGRKPRNTGDSGKGIAGETGILVLIRHFTFSAGISTIKGKFWEPVIGLGVNF